jgi:hypothetical protein
MGGFKKHWDSSPRWESERLFFFPSQGKKLEKEDFEAQTHPRGAALREEKYSDI